MEKYYVEVTYKRKKYTFKGYICKDRSGKTTCNRYGAYFFSSIGDAMVAINDIRSTGMLLAYAIKSDNGSVFYDQSTSEVTPEMRVASIESVIHTELDAFFIFDVEVEMDIEGEISKIRWLGNTIINNGDGIEFIPGSINISYYSSTRIYLSYSETMIKDIRRILESRNIDELEGLLVSNTLGLD